MRPFLSISAVALALLPSYTADANDVIRSVVELQRVVSSGNGRGRKFAIEGTAYAGASERRASFFLLQDGKAVPIIDVRKEDAPSVAPNDLVLVSGAIHLRHSQNPEAGTNPNCRKIVILGKSPPIQHAAISADDMERDNLLYCPVKINGTLIDIRTDEIDPQFTLFVLDCSNRTVYAASTHQYGEIRSMIGAQVGVEGILYKHRGRRIHGRRMIDIARPDAIHILKPPSSGWFHAPEIGDTENISPEAIVALGRRRAIGRVLAVWNDDSLLMRTVGGEPMRVNIVGSPPAVGDCIEAVGYAETDLFHVNLANAIWRKSPNLQLPGEAVTHVDIRKLLVDESGSRKFNVAYHGRTVHLVGTLQDVAYDGGSRRRMIVSANGYAIAVDCGCAPNFTSTPEIGSTVSVTGVCIADTETWKNNSSIPHTRGMFIVLRSPGDLYVVSSPPCWTPKRLVVVIGTLVLLIIAIMIWNMSLRTLSERRGRALYRSRIAQAQSELRKDERTRLAAELHDHLAQNLTAISYQVAAAERSRDIDREASARHLSTAARMLGSSRTELRRCIWDLRCDALDEPDFAQAIRKSIEQVKGDADVEVHTDLRRIRISDQTVHAVLSTTRELVANAVNHGHAKHIRIIGGIADGRLDLAVSDDGCGFDTANAPGLADGHFGLDGIRERLRRHGGEMTIESSPGNGAKVAFWLLLGRETSDDSREISPTSVSPRLTSNVSRLNQKNQ